MQLKNFLLTISCTVLSSFISCSDNIELENMYERNLQTRGSESSPILNFSSREEFEQALASLENSTSTYSATFLLPENQSLLKQSVYEDYMDSYVPDPNFARLLNKDGEIIVNDTVYKITTNGTYYYPLNRKNEFENLFQRDSSIMGTSLSDRLYKISDDIYRYDTFADKREFEESKLNEISTLKASPDRVSYGKNPNYDVFITEDMTHENLLHLIAKNLFGKHFEPTENFTGDRRRVRGTFYDYNYIVKHQIGVKAWTDKKNWIGWSKTEADEMRIGWEDVLLVTKIPDHYSADMNKINNLLESKDEYFYYPGTNARVNARTFVISDLEQSQLKQLLDKGAKEVFNWLKNRYKLSMTPSQWDNIQAAMIVSRTHIYQVIKNEDITKYKIEEFNRTFAKQVTVGIDLNQNSFSGSFPAIAVNIIKAVVKGTTSQIYPTAIGGKVHIAARFGNEWRGMNIEFKSSKDKLFK